MIEKNEVILGFKKLGLQSGDIVLVHSSFKSFNGEISSPQKIIDALLEIVGEKGTVIFPAFNFDFSTHGKDFDIVKTPSQMGILSKFASTHYDSIRTIDPVYSFVVIGYMKNKLEKLITSHSYGSDSMFAKIREYDGKIMCIGVENYNEWMTFFHYVEEMQKVPYRSFKEFSGNIIDRNGMGKKTKLVLYVRNLSKGVETELNLMGNILENEKIIKIGNIGSSKIRFMSSREVYDRTVKEINLNQNILCTFSKKT
jgi:aminoglycoside 3-N-acetyltransferase